MSEKLINDSSKSTNAIIDEFGDLQIVVDVIATRLAECRKLPLDDNTSDEISNLENKLIKLINQQLEIKQNVKSYDINSAFYQYPSMKNFLTLANVTKTFQNLWKCHTYSVDDLLNLSDEKLSSILEELNGGFEDNRKFLTTIYQLKHYSDTRDSRLIFSRNSSDSSGFSESISPVGKMHIDVSCNERNPAIKNHSKEIPSTSSSSMTPPSPIHGSYSSLETESDSANSVFQGQGSPSPKIALNTVSNPASMTLSATANFKQSFLSGSLTRTRDKSRIRFPSVGSKATRTITPRLKTSKSPEWNVGNRVSITSGLENMSASNQSLSSFASHASPSSSKSSSKLKKKKHKPPHVLTVETFYDINFINLSRTTYPRPPTLSPDGLESSSPKSPRTPGTPSTPVGSDFSGKERDFFYRQSNRRPSTSKTSKSSTSNFKAIKKKFKIGLRKLKRNSSSEHIPDATCQDPRLHRKRSGTLPSSKTSLLTISSKTFPASNPGSTCATPLASPDYGIDFGDDSIDSSRPTSLVDTDKTIVAIPNDLEDDWPPKSIPGFDSTEDPACSNQFSAKRTFFRQGSLIQSEEWDILYHELTFKELIGSGHIGTVHRGYWHGDVAIRVIDINLNDEKKLQAFKQEIGVFKKTRHENLELFMGSCMHPPHLAIVTSFCRGKPLYEYIRDSKSKSYDVTQLKLIAEHIAQGMGYLHSKGIVHKDLKSKNIFIHNNRVVITGFGLVGLHSIVVDPSKAACGLLKIPRGWLCYLAPELITNLKPPSIDDDIFSTLPYTNMTDVYAFGTVWYELLAEVWPFQSVPPETIIWRRGKGKKPNLGLLQGGKNVKDLLSKCWEYDPTQRPNFPAVLSSLEKLQNQISRSFSSQPRRSLPGRSPSHDRLFDKSKLRLSPYESMQKLVE